MIVDGTGLVLGRLATIVAKRALNGKRTDIVNAENIVITGNREATFEDFKGKRRLENRRNPNKGPHFPRTPEAIVKRAIRNMVGYKSSKGREALKLVKAYIGVPEQFEKSEKIQFEDAAANPRGKTTSIGDVSKHLGYTW